MKKQVLLILSALVLGMIFNLGAFRFVIGQTEDCGLHAPAENGMASNLNIVMYPIGCAADRGWPIATSVRNHNYFESAFIDFTFWAAASYVIIRLFLRFKRRSLGPRKAA